jgi:hypothetical protein
LDDRTADIFARDRFSSALANAARRGGINDTERR